MAELPQYRLTEKMAWRDVIFDPESPEDLAWPENGFTCPNIEFEGIPAHYMEPLNAAAEAMIAKHGAPGIQGVEGLMTLMPLQSDPGPALPDVKSWENDPSIANTGSPAPVFSANVARGLKMHTPRLPTLGRK